LDIGIKGYRETKDSRKKYHDAPIRRRRRRTLEELRVDPVEKKLAQCERQWLNRVSRMDTQNSYLTNAFRKMKTWTKVYY
jgi:hypothetical protein